MRLATTTSRCRTSGNDDIDDVELTGHRRCGPRLTATCITGPDRIDLGGSGTFMVQAYDENMGVPHFTEDMPMVEAFIQGLAPGNTRYISNGMIDIDPDTGMGEFIVYAPNSAMDGDVIRIFIATGDMEVPHTVMFGMNNLPMGADIADVMMTMDDDPMMVEAMFTDAEGQDLTYEWMSSDDSVATVMADDMDMSMASITAVGVGTATITVTATDSEGGMGMQTFMVTVEYANVAPMAGADIDPVMMTVGDDPMMVATMFTDANMDDMLDYSVDTSNDMVATAMVDMDGMVTITAVGVGTATITVTATDTQGGTGTQTIMVAVAANMAPMAGDAIDPVMLYVGGDSMTVSTTLTDPEGDTLTYAWTSSDEMVATVMADEMDMSMATIMPVGEGPATITVTATDAVSGMSESQEIMVTVGPAPLNPVAMYVITVPSRIEAGMTGSIMITAQDADGALGAITADNAAIDVSLSGDDEMVAVFGPEQQSTGTWHGRQHGQLPHLREC